MSEPCKECRPVLGSLVLAHTVSTCPLRKLRYCGICATYGHNQHNCPDEDAMMFREPLYVEQLVPASLAFEYKLTSRTPLTTHPTIRPPTKPIMEIPENEEAIRAALVAMGEKPMICQQKGRTGGKELLENKKRLQKIADVLGRKLVYTSDGSKSLMDTVSGKKYREVPKLSTPPKGELA